jgi:hypothetical protein
LLFFASCQRAGYYYRVTGAGLFRHGQRQINIHIVISTIDDAVAAFVRLLRKMSAT